MLRGHRLLVRASLDANGGICRWLLVLTFLSLGRSTAADREPAAVGIELDFVQRDHPRVVKECVN